MQSSVVRGSVTQIIENCKQGNSEAQAELWTRYLEKLTSRVACGLHSTSRRVSDEEDIVQETFTAVFTGLQKGSYDDFSNRDSFWRLLVKIAKTKAIDQYRYLNRKKRGDGVRGESAFLKGDETSVGIGAVAHEEPTVEMIVTAKEEMAKLLAALRECDADLPAGELEKVAKLKFECYSNAEIAEKIDRAIPTVERRLRLIRTVWSEINSKDD
jgi:RNA polymerase sigma factor (sigma-70 family)